MSAPPAANAPLITTRGLTGATAVGASSTEWTSTVRGEAAHSNLSDER